MNARAQAGVAVVGAVAAAAAVEIAVSAPMPVAVGDAIAGAALLAGGVIAAGVTRGRVTGILLAVTGVAWLAGTLAGAFVFLHRAPLVHLVLAYPRLWPRERLAAVVIAAGFACALLTPAARSAELTLALAVAVAVTAAVRFRAAAGVERRARAAAFAGAVLLAAAFTVAAVGRLAGGSLDEFSLWTYNVAVAAIAIGLALDLRWGRWEHAAVSELVADLSALERPGALRDRLARTLGDPGLVLGFPAAAGYADETGRPVELPLEGERVVSFVEDRGSRLAVLVHDAALLQDRRLLATALSAVRIAAGNDRMAREVREGVTELEASRRRLVEAAIEQRRALEEELRNGAERRLEAVTERLLAVGAGEAVAELVGNVERAREDLRRFAQGIHPATLTEQGLGAALAESAAVMPFEVTVEAPADRLPPTVEVTVYFLCTEALTNAGKHAGAGRARIRVARNGATVEVAIEDDGAGGADLDRGTGLRGLADRIAALGGTLAIDSPPGEGTRLHASIPI